MFIKHAFTYVDMFTKHAFTLFVFSSMVVVSIVEAVMAFVFAGSQQTGRIIKLNLVGGTWRATSCHNPHNHPHPLPTHEDIGSP
jgi:hypothetical protein